MNAKSRRRIEMGMRALEFIQAHPDTDPGTAVAVARLEQLLARAADAAITQRDGIIRFRAATARKRQLRRWMCGVAIRHLAEVGRAAAREEHELGKTFTFKPGAATYLAFRTAAGSMGAAAQEHREVLAKYGLSHAVLDEFVRLLDELDAAIALGTEVTRTVRVMDGRSRQRFADQQQLLGSWISASTVLGRSRTAAEPEGGPPAEGEVRPAA